MIQNDSYINYFRWQCENHPDLLHADLPGSRVFEVIDIDQALGDFRGSVKEKDFIFRLIMYTYGVRVGEDGNMKKSAQGGFIIARNYSPRKASHLEALRQAEVITDHFIQKMIADSRGGHPLFFSSLDDGGDISVVPVLVTGDGAYAGWRVIFSFDNYFAECVPGAFAPEWLDEGVTPFTYEEEEVIP